MSPVRRAHVIAVGGVVVVAIASGCWFDGGVPKSAVLLCADDAACPAPLACDRAAHVCTPPGAAQPHVVKATFDPPATNGSDVTLTVEADAPLAKADHLRFVPDDPGFGVATIVGSTASFTLHAADVPGDDGAFALTDVDLVASTGTPTTATVRDAVLLVDHRAPAIVGLAVFRPGETNATRGPFSAQPGHDTLIARFFVDDDDVAPDDAAVALGNCPSTRIDPSPGSAAAFATSFAFRIQLVPGCTTDGEASVVATAVDRAGNAAQSETATIDTALSPPEASVLVAIHRPGGTDAIDAAVPGATIDFDVVSARPLASVSIAAVAPFDVDIAPATPSHGAAPDVQWRSAGNVVVAVPDSGSGGVVVTLADAVGNTADIALDPPIPVAQAIASVCTDAAPGCVDFDGDGAFALTASCPQGSDCDDTDPLTHPGAVDLPGDGRAQGCDGVDAPIDETTGVFVDGTVAPGGAGTRASPVATLTEALSLLGARDWIFLRGGQTFGLASGLNARVLGGLDANWARTPVDPTSSPETPSAANDQISFSGTSIGGKDGRAAFDSVRIHATSATTTIAVPVTLSHSYLEGNYAASLVLADQSALEVVTVSGIGASLLSRTILENVLTVGSGHSLLVNGAPPSDFQSNSDLTVDAESGARVTIVNSVVGSIECHACTSFAILHSTVFAQTATPAVEVTGTPLSPVRLVDDIITFASSSATARLQTSVTSASFDIEGVLFDDALGGALLSSPSFTANNIVDVNDCAALAAVCTSSSGNITGNPQLAADLVHVLPASPAVNAGVDVGGGPDALLGDIDGQCRVVGAATSIGPDDQ